MNKSLSDRFWNKVKIQENDCWIWIGCKDPSGYGQIALSHRKKTSAHRISYELNIGPIPEGFDVCHHCDNRACVRPDHLFLGKHIDNMVDQIKKGRKPSFPGDKNGRAKLTSSQVAEIRSQYIPWEVSTVDLAKKFGIGKSQVWNIVSGRSWKR